MPGKPWRVKSFLQYILQFCNSLLLLCHWLQTTTSHLRKFHTSVGFLYNIKLITGPFSFEFFTLDIVVISFGIKECFAKNSLELTFGSHCKVNRFCFACHIRQPSYKLSLPGVSSSTLTSCASLQS